jgi:hypothetical protein
MIFIFFFYFILLFIFYYHKSKSNHIQYLFINFCIISNILFNSPIFHYFRTKKPLSSLKPISYKNYKPPKQSNILSLNILFSLLILRVFSSPFF